MEKQLQAVVLLSLSMALLLVAVEGADHHQQQWKRSIIIRSLLQAPAPGPDACPSACKVRCSRNWMNEMCNKMCNACCHKCGGCVPPGTGQDTRHLCPCYDTMVNPKTNKLKCP